MELTKEQKEILISLLLQISVPLNQAPVVLEIISVLKGQVENNK